MEKIMRSHFMHGGGLRDGMSGAPRQPQYRARKGRACRDQTVGSRVSRDRPKGDVAMKSLLLVGTLLFVAISSGGAAMAKKIDKETLANKIRALAGLDAEERSELLGLLSERKKYGLVWEDKPEDVEVALREQLPVLAEVKERAIIAPGAPNHILIEGDNLNALTCLTYTHSNKVDVIYIDPPYNTGNDHFTYKDKRFLSEYPNGQQIKKDHPLRHSSWLSFMSKRLKSAKNLLRRRGIIFISIDDNEMANLKLLCDQVFREENFVADLIWKSKSGGANDVNGFAVDTEHILVYAAEIGQLSLDGDDEATVTTSYNREDEFGKYALDRLDKQSLGYEESLDFPITGPDGKVYTVFHKDPNHKVARWRWGADTVRERYDELVFENGFVYTKNYESDSAIPRNLLIEERFGRTRSGKTELYSIIGANDFPNPKPSRLIAYLIKLFSDKNCTVIDFFAGSGTTLHAVLSQNERDGGRRQCILCTNNEEGICDNVTYPRISKVIFGYTSQGKVTVELFREKMTLSKLKRAKRVLAEVKKLVKRQKVNILP